MQIYQKMLYGLLKGLWKKIGKVMQNLLSLLQIQGHGLKYIDDDYEHPNGIEGRKDIEETVRELALKNVLIFCLKIIEYTNKMFSIFENVYKV